MMCCLQGNYLEAECVDVDPVGKTITCQYNKPFRGHSKEFTGREFNVPYDVLVVAVSLSRPTRVPAISEKQTGCCMPACCNY